MPRYLLTHNVLERHVAGCGGLEFELPHPLLQIPITTSIGFPVHRTDKMSLKNSQLAFIGGGNMAGAIIGGLIDSIDKDHIFVAEPWEVNRDKLAATGVRVTTSNVEATSAANIVVISVKPQVTKEVCEELAAAWTQRAQLPVVVSIAAGITLGSLRAWLTPANGRTPHVVRVMPNTPALVGEGASGLFASDDVKPDEKKLVNELLGSVSKATEWVDKEELLDVVTGLSGK